MAYVLVSALAKKKGYGEKWLPVSINTTVFQDIFTVYNGLILTLSNVNINHLTYLDLMANRQLVTNLTATVGQWLVANGNTALPTGDVAPTITRKLVHYRDHLRANYNVLRVAPTGHYTSESIDTDKVDLLLQRAGTDYLAMADACLVSVNGFLHRTEGSVDGLYVRDGAASAKIANATNVGILSFTGVGGITLVPITESQVYKQNPDTPLYKGAYINVGQDISHKTPLLVIGGYLHPLDGLYKVVGSQEIFIDIPRLMLPERIFNSVHQIDLGSVLDDLNVGDNVSVAVAVLQSDEFITKYLTLSQSFVILVDADNLYVEKIMCESTDLAGSFLTEVTPIYPLITDLGRLENYWPLSSFSKTILHCKDNLRTNYRFEGTDWWNAQYIDDAAETLRPYDYAAGFMLKLGKETLTY